ncbi:hypothetical protein BDN70DRAFT_870466 [Pholiota conissans]|uniref:Transmembrane protein n=1 Tax=Pholiota conissans TaxID=109636 RepID=A0A9P5ZF56_9AGAR|nr:hypothetical protein BDN70DRAFT_870466 [Pholiota conissans]
MKVFRRQQIKFAPPPSTWPTVHASEDENVDSGNDAGKPPVNSNGKASKVQMKPPPLTGRRLTQQDQDEEDNQKRREALRDLVESWMDRLQLISVITTFFASTEASMLSISAPSSDGTSLSIIAQVANIGIIGSLVVHSSAAIISFLAAFFLIRYKLKVASSEEKEAEEDKDVKQIVESPISMEPVFTHQAALDKDKDLEKEPRGTLGRSSTIGRRRSDSHPTIEHETDPIPGSVRVPSGSPHRTIWSSNPHLVQVGPFQNYPPTHLLRRCHTLCVVLTAFGFVLALMGILCFAWDRLPPSVSISATCFMGICVCSSIYILVKPYPPEGTSPHIYIFDEF